MKNFVDVKELAKMMNVPESWLYQQTRLGAEAIPHYRFGKHIRFIPDEVFIAFKKKAN